MAVTLAAALDSARVGVDEIEREHPEMLQLSRVMLGVAPASFGYLAISPAGLDTYGLIIPSFTNMPFTLWGFGGVPTKLFSLAMYVSSRAAGCMYCSAHSCSFALRRGAPPSQLEGASDGDAPRERATRAMARGLGSVPSTFVPADRQAMNALFAREEVEWLVLGVAMMGLLNKFMDATGTPLERAVFDDVDALIRPTGWSPGKHELEGAPAAEPPPLDSLATKLSILPVLPRALLNDKRLTAGVPGRWPDFGAFTRELIGWDFPMVRHLRHERAVKAIGAALRRNVAGDACELDVRVKTLASLIFAVVVGSEVLRDGSRQMAAAAGATTAEIDGVVAFAQHDTDLQEEPSVDAAGALLTEDIRKRWSSALVVAKAASFSPARVTRHVITTHAKAMSPRQSVELLLWLGVFQMLHRISRFYGHSPSA